MKSTTKHYNRRPVSETSKQDAPASSTGGFTIVEVLIVLAIAGLILVIVFEAIPSVTRALRNGRRKHDVSLILGVVSEYELKDSDNFPQNCSGNGSTSCKACDGTTAQCAVSNTDQPNDYFLHFAQDQLSYYTYTSSNTDPVTLTGDYPQNNNGDNPPPNTNTEQVQIYDYEKCTFGVPGSTTNVGADYSDVVALYAFEESNGTSAAQCQEL